MIRIFVVAALSLYLSAVQPIPPKGGDGAGTEVGNGRVTAASVIS